MHSPLIAVHCFNNGYVEKQPVAWKEYCAEFWLKELQESMDRCTGCCDITEILLKKVLNTIKSINQSINHCNGCCKSFCICKQLLLSVGTCILLLLLHRGYLFFSVKDQNLFHQVDTIGNISIFHQKKKFCLFHALNPFWEKLFQNPVQFFSVIPRGIALLHSNALQHYVKREKFKVNDIIFQSGCEARAINLGNKNMKIGIFTGGISVR